MVAVVFNRIHKQTLFGFDDFYIYVALVPLFSRNKNRVLLLSTGAMSWLLKKDKAKKEKALGPLRRHWRNEPKNL